jgi:hypothetical protein
MKQLHNTLSSMTVRNMKYKTLHQRNTSLKEARVSENTENPLKDRGWFCDWLFKCGLVLTPTWLETEKR